MNSSIECLPKGKKVEAMKKYSRGKFVYNLVLYSLTSLITFLFFTYPFWLPSVDRLLSCDLLNDVLLSFDAKCCFVVGNLIVVVLVWESRMKGSSCLSPASDIYNEYVARRRGKHGCEVNYSKEANGVLPTLNFREKNHGNGEEKICCEEKSKKKKTTRMKKEVEACESFAYRHHGERKKGMRSCKSESEIVKKEKAKGEEHKEMKDCIPNEELNERVEAFIARVNKQRLLEAKSMENDRG